MGHSEYNDAIQHAADEQLLLNLVRLKYRESPLVLDVGSISAQFEVIQGFSVDGAINENVGQAPSNVARQLSVGGGGGASTVTRNTGSLTGRNPDALSLGGRFSYAERPTVIYNPLQGEDFAQRMLTPVSLATIVSLVNSGWRIDRVLNVIAKDLNGLDNAGAASGPTPEVAPQFAEFQEAVDLLRRLQLRRAVSLEFDAGPQALSEPIAADRITPEAVLQAAGANARFLRTDDGLHAVLTRTAERPVLRLRVDADTTAIVDELRALLQLTADRDDYPLVAAQTPAARAAVVDGRHTALVVDTRSVMGVMFYLSQGVETPGWHERSGLVTHTQDEHGQPFDWSQAVGNVLTIRTSILPPTGAALSVRRRGFWYFIRDDDLNSKSTFLLLSQLFSLRAGARAGGGPLLTLPVGG